MAGNPLPTRLTRSQQPNKRRVDGGRPAQVLVAIPLQGQRKWSTRWSIVGYCQFEHAEQLAQPNDEELTIIDEMEPQQHHVFSKYQLPIGVKVADSGWLRAAIDVELAGLGKSGRCSSHIVVELPESARMLVRQAAR